MNFFLANCLQEDNKCAGKKATYAETGQNTDELQTNKKQEKQDGGVKKSKVVATAQDNSIGQANLDQLARETSTPNLLPAVVPGGAEMGVGF
jgi:hypothetical protein